MHAVQSIDGEFVEWKSGIRLPGVVCIHLKVVKCVIDGDEIALIEFCFFLFLCFSCFVHHSWAIVLLTCHVYLLYTIH